jgi:hypothetical protein
MQEHHYLGALPKIGETLRYLAVWREQWLGLVSFSAAAWKCTARDQWIGWDFRHQFDRLKLVVNNSRFLILPGWHLPNLGSRILGLCQRRLVTDWRESFGHPVLLLETFVDRGRFRGTVYKAANWTQVGNSRGVSTHPARLPGRPRISQNGLRQTFAGRRPGGLVRPYASLMS